MLRLSKRNCAIVLSGGLGRGDETMGLARRLRHNPWIAAAASWRMQRFQSRYCRYVDASGRRSEPRGRLLLVSENASSKAFIWSRRTRQALTASLRSILWVGCGWSALSATYCGLVIGRAARLRGSMRLSSRLRGSITSVTSLRRRLSSCRFGGCCAVLLRRMGCPRPESVESLPSGCLCCPLRVPVRQRMPFSGSALAKPAPSRDRRVRRLRAGVVRAMLEIPERAGILRLCLLVSYRALAS